MRKWLLALFALLFAMPAYAQIPVFQPNTRLFAQQLNQAFNAVCLLAGCNLIGGLGVNGQTFLNGGAYIKGGISADALTLTGTASLNGGATAPTVSLSDNSANVATTSWVNGQGYLTGASGVTAFNTRKGPVTLQSSDVTGALGYTPANIVAPSFTGGATITGGMSTDSLTSTGNGTFSGTGYLKLPSGTTAQEPGSPSVGMLRWNTDTARMELYSGSTWQNHVRLSGDTMTGPLTVGTVVGPLQIQGTGGVSASSSAPGIATPTGINTGSIYQLGAGGFFTGTYVLGTATNSNNLVTIDVNNSVPGGTFSQPTSLTGYMQVWYGEQGAERTGFGIFGRCDVMPTAFSSLAAESCKHEFDIQNWSGILPNSGTSFLANGTLPASTVATNAAATASSVSFPTNAATANGATLNFSSANTASIPLWSLVSIASPIQLTTANPAVNTAVVATATSVSGQTKLHFGSSDLSAISQGMLAVGTGISGLVTVTATNNTGTDRTVTLNTAVTVGSGVNITFIGSTISFTGSPITAGVAQGDGVTWNVGFPGGVWQIPTASGFSPTSSAVTLDLPAYETTGTPGIYQPLQPGRTVSFSPILWGTYVASIQSTSITLSAPVYAGGVGNGVSINFQSGNVLCAANWGSNILTGELITAASGNVPANTYDLLLHSGQTGQGCSSDPMVLSQAVTSTGVGNGENITATPAQNSAYPTQTGPTKNNMGLIGMTADCFGSAGCNIGFTLGTTQPWETGLYFPPSQVFGMGIVVDAGCNDPGAINNSNQNVCGPRISGIFRNEGDASDKSNLVLQTMGSEVAGNPVLRVMTAAGNPNETTNTGEVFRINQDGSPITAGTTSGYFNTQQTVLTAASGSWTVPFNVNRVRVLMCGAGGGGGSVGGGAAATATGGTSGVWVSAYVNVTPGGNVSYAVGQAGTGGASGGTNNGNPGGNTTFGSLTANGGLGGTASNSGNASAPTTTAVNALIPIANPNNSILIDNWSIMNVVAGSSGSGSSGGKSVWGTAGSGGSSAAGGNAGASQFCSGGGGAGDTAAITHAGGNGANGIIVLLN